MMAYVARGADRGSRWQRLPDLPRFWAIWEYSKIHAVATAAVRRAKNAERFTRPAAALLNHEISVLSQQAEASYVARGLALNLPRATGLVADLGGGSVEIIKHAAWSDRGSRASFDFGHLSKMSSRPRSMLPLAATDWISAAAPKRLYGVGGSFRAFCISIYQPVRLPIARAAWPDHSNKSRTGSCWRHLPVKSPETGRRAAWTAESHAGGSRNH